MNKVMSGVLASTLAVSFAAAALPANAASMYLPNAPEVSSDVQNIDYKPWMRNHNRGDDHRWSNMRHRRDNGAYWNGHRGYRDWRPGYKRHGDFWFPAGAFIAGALITGAIANQNNGGRADAHVQWCYDHYRSYRASDNTFQPNYGPRKICRSPY